MLGGRAWIAAAVGLVLTGLHGGPALAQVPAGDKVGGAQLQTWLDQKFSYAGVHQPSGCVILNAGEGDRRVLFIRCPNGWAAKLSGSARVDGDQWCTQFPIPNTPPGDDCVTWHSLGDWKFEQRKGGTLDTSVIVLPQGLAGAK
jgi:hypothetical protein